MATSSVAVGARRSTADRVARAVDRWLLPIYVVGVTAYLILPVAVMILFSFNDPAGRSNLVWKQFSFEAWLDPLGRPGLAEAVRNSLVVAFLSTIIATALGTLIALALTRYQFRGRATTNVLIFLPMATPEIVLGASLLTMFVASVQLPIPQGVLFPLNIRTILIAHIMFNISFVVVTVKARLSNFPRNLEEAAMDLGANEWTTFWKVTFPLILPGVIAAALLAFSLSIDDFIITNLVSGATTNTFPIWVYSIQKNALPVQINVIGSMVFLGAVGFVLISNLLAARRRR